jgi:hypothetical protein
LELGADHFLNFLDDSGFSLGVEGSSNNEPNSEGPDVDGEDELLLRELSDF